MMSWTILPLQVAGTNGSASGRWRLTAAPDIPISSPLGDLSHDHESLEAAEACDRCDEFIASLTGKLSKRQQAKIQDEKDWKEYQRLKAKFSEPSQPHTWPDSPANPLSPQAFIDQMELEQRLMKEAP
ncbi:MAG: hypothetical protein WBX25_24095 [Rhodomicrobium sp.]